MARFGGGPSRLSIQAKNLDSIQKALEAFPSAYGNDARDVLRGDLTRLQGDMKLRSSISPLHAQTRKLERSWGVELTGTRLSDLDAAVFSYSGYSIIHELGLRVFPGGSKQWIYIPTEFNRVGGTGKAINTPQKVLDDGGRYTRQWLNGRRKNVIVDRDDVAMYILARWAQYKPQLGFFDRGEVATERVVTRLGDQLIKTWGTVAP